MAKKRTALVPIAKASERRAAYKKRKACLLKKTEELSVLCGVQACIVMYSEDSGEPDMWPPREETLSILSRFNNLPEAVRNKNMMNQKDFVSKQVEKLQVELQKVNEENTRFETMVLLHDVLAGQCTIADVAGAGGMLMLSAMVEARLNEVRERMDGLLSVPQPVGPLEEVLVQGQCSLGVAGAGAVLQEQHQYFSGVDCADMAPQGKKQQGMFGLANPDVAPQQEQQHYLPNWNPAVGSSNREGGYGPESADVAPARKKQCVFGLGNADMAPQLGEQLCFPNWYPLVGSSEGGCAPESTDVAPPGKEQCMFTDADMAQLLGEQFCLPNWYPAGGSREGGNVTESADVAAVPLGPEADDEIDQFFDWSFSGIEEILSVN